MGEEDLSLGDALCKARDPHLFKVEEGCSTSGPGVVGCVLQQCLRSLVTAQHIYDLRIWWVVVVIPYALSCYKLTYQIEFVVH